MKNAAFLKKHRVLFDRFIDTLADVNGRPTEFLEDLTDNEVYIMAHFMHMLGDFVPTASFEILRIASVRGIADNKTAPESL